MHKRANTTVKSTGHVNIRSSSELNNVFFMSLASSNCDCFEPCFFADYALPERLVHAKFLRLSALNFCSPCA